jgi:hypothetical protein
VVCDQDQTALAGPAAWAAERAPRGELLDRLDLNNFTLVGNETGGALIQTLIAKGVGQLLRGGESVRVDHVSYLHDRAA